jgi:hypothetical protein
LDATPALAREVAPGLAREQCRQAAASWFERAAQAALALSAHDSARELLTRTLDFLAEDDEVARARVFAQLGELTASTADMDEGVRLLEQSLALARAAGDQHGIARAAAALSWVFDQQVQFMPAVRMAEDALREIGERDDADTARLLVRRATALYNGTDAIEAPLTDARRALAIARELGDRRLELDALDLVTGLEGGGVTAWQELERLALDSGAWAEAADAMHSQAFGLIADHAAAARPLIARAIELGTTRGLRESLAWSHYAESEVGLVTGDWDGAVTAARRALEIGIANGYDRPVVRTWSTVLPVASARGDVGLLDEGYVWLTTRFREPENPSPYARIVIAARQLEIAHRGMREPFVPDVEEQLASFELRSAAPSWLAALEIVVDAWLAAGELGGAKQALERMEGSAMRPGAATLGRAAYRLFRGRLLVAQGADPGAEAERALAGFRKAQAPWWCAKVLRLLGTPEALAEAVMLERRLGIPV